jgi:SagB-type dehydrogenase family enzyme
MTELPLLRFRDDVELAEAEEDRLAICWPAGRLTLKQADAGLVAAMRALASGGAPEAVLADLAADTGVTATARLYLHLRSFRQLGLLEYAVGAEGGPLATLVPITTEFEPRRRPLDGAGYVLSRFAYCRRHAEHLVLESPLADCRVRLESPILGAWLARLAGPVPPDELVGGADGLPMESARALLELLAGAGLVVEVGVDGASREVDDLALRQWEIHDLVFHRQSRLGEDWGGYGGTFRFLGQIEPLPAVKPPSAGAVIELARPDLEALRRSDIPFTAVLEERRSVRAYGEGPISVRQLGELLYRAARVRRIVEADPARGIHYATSSRPYPSGGACYELELYPVVNHCDGLEPGLYHYDPLAHVLRRLRERDELVEQLIQDIAGATRETGEVQVVLGITARFQRVSWKYERMAYALILKHVGVLYQTLYLVATAMGLGPCGVGGGQSDLLARAIGSDYLAESAVGEFLLGSRPDR